MPIILFETTKTFSRESTFFACPVYSLSGILHQRDECGLRAPKSENKVKGESKANTGREKSRNKGAKITAYRGQSCE
jgi:hypothetical protein